MTFAWHLFEIGINAFQGWLYCYFLNTRMSLKSGIGKSRHRYATWVTIAAVAVFYSLYIWFDVPVTDHAAWGFTLIYSLAEFSERWYVKVAWNACLAVLMLGVVTLSSVLLIQVTGTTWELIMQPTAIRIIYVLSGNLMALLVMYVQAKVKPKQNLVSWRALLVFILMNAALLIGLEMQYQLSWENVVYKHEMLITMACIIFVSACSIALFELLSAKTERAVELETQIENDRMIKVYNEELQAMYKELMEHQHDMKHQFCALEELIARGEVTESQRYLDQLRESVLPVRRKV